MASLNLLVERARHTREVARAVRTETARLTEESAYETRRLAERRHIVEESVAQSTLAREQLPTWPAWAPPDTRELRLTLVQID